MRWCIYINKNNLHYAELSYLEIIAPILTSKLALYVTYLANKGIFPAILK